MSILTTAEQLIAPNEGDGIELSSGLVAWANPASWTPIFVTTAQTVIAGVVLLEVGVALTWSQLQMEVAIGYGPEGGGMAEIGCFGFYSPNSGIGGPSQGPEPTYPIGTIPPGMQVSARLRANQVLTVPIAVKYYEAYDGDIADFDELTLGMLPESADYVAITPNASAGLPSDWAVLSEALEVDTDVVALVMSTPVPDLDLRWELGIGPDGAETHVETFVSASRTNSIARSWFAERPGPYPMLAGQRAVIRVRTSGTSTTEHRAALQVFRHEAEVPGGGGTIGPLLWITIPFRPPLVT